VARRHHGSVRSPGRDRGGRWAGACPMATRRGFRGNRWRVAATAPTCATTQPPRPSPRAAAATGASVTASRCCASRCC
jgi:hypothetical protein